jgi:hypothetical protein
MIWSKSNFNTDAHKVLPNGDTLCVMWINQSKIVVNHNEQYEAIEIAYKERKGYGLDGELFEGFFFIDSFHYLTDLK